MKKEYRIRVKDTLFGYQKVCLERKGKNLFGEVWFLEFSIRCGKLDSIHEIVNDVRFIAKEQYGYEE